MMQEQILPRRSWPRCERRFSWRRTTIVSTHITLTLQKTPQFQKSMAVAPRSGPAVLTGHQVGTPCNTADMMSYACLKRRCSRALRPTFF